MRRPSTRQIATAAALLALALGLGSAAGAQEPTRQTFVVRSENMLPRLAVNQRVEFDLAAYAQAAPAVGDIVLFRPPRAAVMGEQRMCGRPRDVLPDRLCARARREVADEPLRFVKRVVAVGGDRVAFRRGRVVRNGVRERRKGLVRCPIRFGCTFRGRITVPAGHVYLAGDNRPASDDSRFWGAIPVAWVVGRYVRTVGTAGT